MVLPPVQPITAQDDKVYASGSGLLSTQGAGTPYEGSSSAKPGISGTALGVSGEFGTFLTRSLSLAFEVSVLIRFESIQFTGIPTARIDSQHRDLLFSGLFHIHVTSSGPIRVALVAGPSVIREGHLATHGLCIVWVLRPPVIGLGVFSREARAGSATSHSLLFPITYPLRNP